MHSLSFAQNKCTCNYDANFLKSITIKQIVSVEMMRDELFSDNAD